jgi:hypothetical protein
MRLEAATLPARLETADSPVATSAAGHEAPTAPAPFDKATAPIAFSPAAVPSIDPLAEPEPAEALRDLRFAFELARPAIDEQHAALRRAGVALTGAILLAVLACLWFVSFGWPGAAGLWLLAGACACRAAVQGARISGDSAAVARAAGVLAFTPGVGQVLATWLMHRAGRALRSRLAPSERGGAGRARQRLRARAARTAHAGARPNARP